jgi:phosphate transport system protein
MHRHFEDELETLRSLLIRMASLVDEQIETAIQALSEGNAELVRHVIEREEKINELDLTVDGQCQRIFALTQPVAVDLRLLLAAMRINSDLERVGDIAVNIAERVEPLTGQRELIGRVQADQMIGTARDMLATVIDAFVHSNSTAARAVFEQEEEVDRLGRDSFYNLIAEMKANPAIIEPAAHLMALLRHVERLADHATNIAENVIFVSEARVIKHSTIDQVSRRGV